MSIQAQNWVINNSRQSGSLYWVLMVIANHANAHGEAFIDAETIAHEAGRLSERQTRRLIGQLHNTPEMTIIERSIGGRRSNRYKINFDCYKGDKNPDKLTGKQPCQTDTVAEPENPDNMTGNPDPNTLTNAATPPTPPYKDNHKELNREGTAETAAHPKTPDVIEAVREACGLYPPKLIWPKIVEAIGENLDRRHLRLCVLTWVARGFKKTNYDGWLLDWYVHGIPPGKPAKRTDTDLVDKIRAENEALKGEEPPAADVVFEPDPCPKCGQPICDCALREYDEFMRQTREEVTV